MRARAPTRCVRALLALLLVAGSLACGDVSRYDGSPHRVYVILGFHSNFYHSWRGDTPDEAGFGTDIRIVREILRMLGEAEARGEDVRAYWDTDNLFTLETILPEYAPDIIEGIRQRVLSGRDEIVLAPYDNGLLGAMTPDEVRAAVRWSISNPWGSGARDLFGTFTPLLRPNEAMTTTGLAPLLREEGVAGLVLAYSSWPFTGFSNFVPTLPPEQRYNPTWLRLGDEGPRLLLLPCVSIGDVLNQVSLERWLLDLRQLQLDGTVDRDLVIHINFDADVDTWLPQPMPAGLAWFPNSGGLPEYIRAVNRYAWAEFTTPGRYLATHEPVGEVTIRRDTADGAYDGHYSWAEKLPSHDIWTALEQSRLATERAEALARTASADLAARAGRLLWEGRDASFFQRLRALSTTHFGMSTPLVNEERQAVGERVAGAARSAARAALRMLAEQAAARARVPAQALYAFELRDLREPPAVHGVPVGGTARTLLRLPLWLPEASDAPALALVDASGAALPFSLVNVEPLADGGSAAELWALLPLAPGETRTLALVPGASAPPPDGAPPSRLESGPLSVALDAHSGIAALRLGDWQVGGADLLESFVTYRSADAPVSSGATDFALEAPPDVRREGLSRARVRARIPFDTPDGPVEARLRFDLSLPDAAPWLVADVEIAYPYTEKHDVLANMQQQLRRYLDLRWIEVAPFALRPRLTGSREHPLRVWKHNWLGVTSWFDLDYARVNPRNAELDAFNHQVTAGWVAASDRERGLLVGHAADVRASYAFAPMRLRESEGRQVLQLNPFGSYYGRQLDYSHMGGTGIGTEFTTLGSSALRPNGPSYDGETERFSLLLAPYRGDAPPAGLRADAEAFFHGPAVVVTRAPAALGPVALPLDVEAFLDARRLAAARQAGGRLPAPRAFLVNPTGGAVDVVWDEPGDARIDGYELEWRQGAGGDWLRTRVERARRHHVSELADGAVYVFRMRSVGAGEPSDWTPVLETRVGPVPPASSIGVMEQAGPWLLLRTFWYGLVHVFTTP